VKKELRSKLEQLCADEQIEEALTTIEHAQPDEGCRAELLVWKAKCLQLSDNATLEEVEDTLRAALAHDEDHVSAWIELGYFLLNVRDQAGDAQKAFLRALAIQSKENTELVVGLAKCAKEIEPSRNHDELRRTLLSDLIDGDEVNAALSE
jgi:tetratricopeptide (TPR) repeat protein